MNKHTILNIVFSLFNDINNWRKDNLSTIEQKGENLCIKLGSSASKVERAIQTNPLNASDRFRLAINGSIRKTPNSNASNLKYYFNIYSDKKLFSSEVLEIPLLKDAEDYVFFIDRSYILNEPLSNLSFTIDSLNGWENEVLLKDISFEDYKIDLTSIRTYFVPENIFETAFENKDYLGAFIFRSYKIDDIETLTSDFFGENNIQVGTNISEWNFAKANLDNSIRDLVLENPNCYNPFEKNLKLVFNGPAKSGKAEGSQTGSYYGSGIVKIGFDLPMILNRNIKSQKAPFFIDIDYTKNLKIIFDVVVSKNQNVFLEPLVNREYYIIWDSEKCEGQFYYYDRLNNNNYVEQYFNGFLSGIATTENIEIPSQVEEFTQLVWSNTRTSENRQGYEKTQSVMYESFLYPVSQVKFQTSYDGVNFSDNNITSNSHNFDLKIGSNYFRLKAINNFGVFVYSNVLKYERKELGNATDYYYISTFECSDPINNPNIVSWVDYLDASGVQRREIIGCRPCVKINASIILATNGVRTCVPQKCMEYYFSVPNVSGEYYFISGTDCNGQPFEMEFGADGNNPGGSGRFCALSASGGGGNGYVYSVRECATVRP